MKNHNLEYVTAISEEGSFSRAAQKLYVSQPALSAAVKKIEAELHGVPLFDRSVNPVVLTQAGRYYLERLREIDGIEEEIDRHFAALAGVKSGTVNIGSSSYFCTYVLPGWISGYHRKNPESEISLSEGETWNMGARLKSGDLDLVLDVETLDPEQFDRMTLGEEYIILAVPAEFAVNDRLREYRLTRESVLDRSFLTSSVPSVPLKLFRNVPFLLLKRNHDIYKRALTICRNAGFEPHIALYLDQMLTAYNIARNGQAGAVFIRDTILRYTEPTAKLFYYRLSDPLAVRDIRISFRKIPGLSPLARDFVNYVRRTEEEK